MVITDDQWDKAAWDAQNTLDEHEVLSEESELREAILIDNLLFRYNRGERTEHLYNALLKVE